MLPSLRLLNIVREAKCTEGRKLGVDVSTFMSSVWLLFNIWGVCCDLCVDVYVCGCVCVCVNWIVCYVYHCVPLVLRVRQLRELFRFAAAGPHRLCVLFGGRCSVWCLVPYYWFLCWYGLVLVCCWRCADSLSLSLTHSLTLFH